MTNFVISGEKKRVVSHCDWDWARKLVTSPMTGPRDIAPVLVFSDTVELGDQNRGPAGTARRRTPYMRCQPQGVGGTSYRGLVTQAGLWPTASQ